MRHWFYCVEIEKWWEQVECKFHLNHFKYTIRLQYCMVFYFCQRRIGSIIMSSNSKQGLGMQGITLRNLNGRNYRLHTVTLNGVEHRQNSSFATNTAIQLERGQQAEIHVPVPEASIGSIIGRRGETIRRLEQEYRVNITIPRSGISRNISIRGTEQAIQKAQRAIIQKITPYQRPSHFISLPFHGKLFQQKIAKLQQDLIQVATEQISDDLDDNDNGIDESIFVKPERLHLTLGILLLDSKEKIDQAINTLQELSTEIDAILNNQPLMVEINGLKLMKGTPDNAHVMYVEAKDSSGDRLDKISALLRERFNQAGLLLEADRPLKLHLTIINTTHRGKTTTTRSSATEKSEAANKKYSNRIPFRATEMLQVYESCQVGTFECLTIEIARMGSHSPDHGGYIAESAIKIS
ncbi:AKAP7 2'5' RNA ligase-like domain-containing protein [Syncephalis fuscata]|nr:AKAP7 2'5' RNA ligase-like domain-containing protein [Syncephalis fuscata]